jgi:hypothetical protein
MATTKGSQRERIEALKKKIRRDAEDTLQELDRLLLETVGGGNRPEPRGGGGPGPGDTGP